MPRIPVVFAALLLTCVPAAAQPQPPAFSVSAGAGIAFPFHSDYPSSAPEWHVSVRTRIAEHVIIEGMYDEWRATTTTITRDLTYRNQHNVVIGHVDELQIDDANRIGLIGINFLATGATGRLRISGGGGAGVMTFRSTYSTTQRGCTSPTFTLCRDFTNTNAEGTLAVQAVADVDVAVTSHVSAFGRALLAGPPQDMGAGHFGVVAGIRASLR